MSGQAGHDGPDGVVASTRSTEEPQFRVRLLAPLDGVAVVDLWGEIDIHTSPEFKAALMPLIEEGRQHVVVDAGQVTFMDSTALGVFLSGEKRMRPRGGSIVIVCKDSIARLFEITGLDRVFTICRTRDEALRVAAARQEHLGTALPDDRAATRR